MKKGLKAVSCIAAAILMCSSFVGCSGGGSTGADGGKTKISVGGWPSKEGKDKENAEARKTRFEEANPEFEIVPDNWSFDLKSFYPKAAGGQLPTVYNTHFTEASQIIAAGYSADLTDALKEHGLLEKYNSDILKVVSNDNRIYAFPVTAYALGLAFNVDMMEAAGLMEADGTPKQPKDWYELAEFAVKIKEATGKPGFVFPSSNNYGGWIFTPVAWSFGADFMEKGSDGKWKAIFDSPEGTEALQFIKDLKWKYDVLPANTLIDGEEYYKILGTGGAGIQITAGDVPRKLTAYGMQPEQIGMMAMPKGPKRYVTLMGGTIYAISDKADKKQ
ncbi:MAG: ABC transporter substrate-binding protein, partial [Monoglobaceae bacterium]